jgi:transposase InsO family protein
VTAVDLAQLFFEHVECRFGTPKGIITDRDSRITSEFWHEICEIQMIKRHLSTAYHSQTNGQSEALNHIVEDYLHAYSAEDPTA